MRLRRFPAGRGCIWSVGVSTRPRAGNLGPEKIGLKTDKNDLCTWLSRDGGLTWIDVIDDVYIYEYLNHGNIIAMAKFRCAAPAAPALLRDPRLLLLFASHPADPALCSEAPGLWLWGCGSSSSC